LPANHGFDTIVADEKQRAFLRAGKVDKFGGYEKKSFSNPGSEGYKFSPWVHVGLRATTLI